MDRRNEQKPTEPMKNPLGSSYPVDVLAQLQSDAQSRRVFNAMPRAIQLDILQHNTMTPEALRHFYNAEQPRPSPITALLAMYLGFHLLGVGGMVLLPVLLLLLKQFQDAGVVRVWK